MALSLFAQRAQTAAALPPCTPVASSSFAACSPRQAQPVAWDPGARIACDPPGTEIAPRLSEHCELNCGRTADTRIPVHAAESVPRPLVDAVEAPPSVTHYLLQTLFLVQQHVDVGLIVPFCPFFYGHEEECLRAAALFSALYTLRDVISTWRPRMSTRTHFATLVSVNFERQLDVECQAMWRGAENSSCHATHALAHELENAASRQALGLICALQRSKESKRDMRLFSEIFWACHDAAAAGFSSDWCEVVRDVDNLLSVTDICAQSPRMIAHPSLNKLALQLAALQAYEYYEVARRRWELESAASSSHRSGSHARGASEQEHVLGRPRRS